MCHRFVSVCLSAGFHSFLGPDTLLKCRWNATKLNMPLHGYDISSIDLIYNYQINVNTNATNIDGLNLSTNCHVDFYFGNGYVP